MSKQHSALLPGDVAPRHGRLRKRGLRSVFRWLKAFFTAGGWFDRAALVRHFALCAAALGAYLLRFELSAGREVLWIIAAAALLNLLSFLFADRPKVGAFFRFISPVLGVAGWTALIHLSGGVGSPFLAGLGLEILLAARTFRLMGCALVTAASVAALWLQQGLLGFEGAARPLIVHTGTLLGIGVVTSFLVRHWMREQAALDGRATLVRERLQRLEDELDAARNFGKMGESVARLAHGLKNTVHALRGFSALIAKRAEVEKDHMPALDGLDSAIDQLEALARATLGAPGTAREEGHPSKGTRVDRAVTKAALEVAGAYPGLEWTIAGTDARASVEAPPAVIQEVLVELFRNAADAMAGRGEIEVRAVPAEGRLCIHVRDHGPGIDERDLNRIFKPGFTTKSGGNGLGLFLARNLIEKHGGALRAKPAGRQGTTFCVQLPIEGSEQRAGSCEPGVLE